VVAPLTDITYSLKKIKWPDLSNLIAHFK
jgi:hypothetical protein